MKKYPVVHVRLRDRELDRPAAPPVAALTDHEAMLKWADHQAKQDVDSGAIDAITVRTFAGSRLPVEIEAYKRLDREQQNATAGLKNATSVGEALNAVASVSLLVDAPGLAKDTPTTLDQEHKAADQTDADIAARRAERGELEQVLRGRAQYSDGIVWPGDVPPMPGPDTSKRDVRRSGIYRRDLAATWLPRLVMGPVETVIVVLIMRAYLQDDGWGMPIGLSFASLLGLLLIPDHIGESVARVWRRGFGMAKEWVVLTLMSVGWLAAVAAAVFFRVSFDRNKAIRDAAEAQNLPLDQVDVSAVYNTPVQASMWATLVAVFGLVVVLVRLFTYNPVIAQIVRTDLKLVDLYDAQFVHNAVVNNGEALIDAGQKNALAVQHEWVHYRDYVLPSRTAEFCGHYRRWLANYFGNPDITAFLFPVDGSDTPPAPVGAGAASTVGDDE